MDESKKKRRQRMPWLALWVAIGAGLAGATAGVLLGVTAPREPAGPTSALQSDLPPWANRLQAVVRYSGPDWVNLAYAERVLKVTGEAPSAEAKALALDLVADGVRNDTVGQAAVGVIVDGVSVVGGEVGVGAALAALGPDPDVAACQTAFDQTLAGRFVAFESGSARISAESARLLDALTGAALICKSRSVEIGGHTDRQGGASANVRLSQARADAVRTYLVEKGVPATRLTAVGYGESRPLDTASTEEADAKNRRIAFTVTS